MGGPVTIRRMSFPGYVVWQRRKALIKALDWWALSEPKSRFSWVGRTQSDEPFNVGPGPPLNLDAPKTETPSLFCRLGRSKLP